MRHPLNGDLPDHPVIQNMMATGYPDCIVPKTYICPRCGQECDEYYINEDDEVVGCEKCITICNAEDWEY